MIKLYTEELQLQSEELNRIRKIAEENQVTLVYSAKDMQRNQAVVLRDVLESVRR